MNYRCTSFILGGALRVIGHNPGPLSEDSSARSREGGRLSHVQEVQGPTPGGGLHHRGIRSRMEEGVKPEDMAVLFGPNLDAGILAGRMMEQHMPFAMREHIRNVFEHFIGRNMRSYMELASGSRSPKHFLDVANCPKRYISGRAWRTGKYPLRTCAGSTAIRSGCRTASTSLSGT